jgi:hypothetical protein
MSADDTKAFGYLLPCHGFFCFNTGLLGGDQTIVARKFLELKMNR